MIWKMKWKQGYIADYRDQGFLELGVLLWEPTKWDSPLYKHEYAYIYIERESILGSMLGET